MIDTFKKVVKTIEWIRSHPSSNNEAQIRQSLITPILRFLGWDEETPGEVKTEYPLQYSESGRVDYALCSQKDDNPLVFIEAKKLGHADSGESQLFRYAFEHGVDLLVLTDGDVWNFYLATGKGLPPDRRFYRAILSANKEKVKEYAHHFEEFLEKDRVYSGEAVKVAKNRLDNRREKEKAKNSIPKVWQAMLDGSNPDLRDILVQAVENECGTKPDLDDLDNFLIEKIHHITATSKPRAVVKPSRETPSNLTIHSANSLSGKIIGYTLYGKMKEPGSGRRTLIKLLKDFAKRDPQFMQRFSEETTGRTRRLIAQKREDLYDEKHLIKDSVDLENGWWLGTNLSSEQIRRKIQTACKVAGIKYGSELILITES